jgi:hypothetical protein
VYDTVAFKLAQALRQHLLRHPGKQLLNLAKPPSFVMEVEENQWFPFSANDAGGHFYGTVEFIVHGLSPDTWFQKGTYWRKSDISIISAL